MTAKALHSIRMCLTVQVVWQVKHCGCDSCFSMKEWVNLVWPMCNQDMMTCSLLDFLKAGHGKKLLIDKIKINKKYCFEQWNLDLPLSQF